MKRSKIEVLAPAGGPQALQAAVRCGADAVYLSGKSFGARASAQNFDREELREAVRYCRQRGVRVHVTVNTLFKEEELPRAVEFIQYLCSLPVDAVLVQDMGLLCLVRELAPQLSLHASTQMSLCTPRGVELVRELGVSRAVLARELSLEEIREIHERCDGIELEAFVHGALCMSVSGQCYLSAALGGRSGNRGRCAQPCRLEFCREGGRGGNDHALSLKDLSFIVGLQRLREAGVCSAKIEGRMKRPEYVAAATAACRIAADGGRVSKGLLDNLRAVFSRSGFTCGYLTNEPGENMFGARRKEDVTAATGQVLSELRNLYRGERGSVTVNMELSQEDDTVSLTVWDAEGRRACESLTVSPEQAGGSALSEERAREQLKKTGGTPFVPGEISISGQLFGARVSDINALRRGALDGLLERRGECAPVAFGKFDGERKPWEVVSGKKPIVRLIARTPEQLSPQALRCDELALPVETPLKVLLDLRERAKGQMLLDLPRAPFGVEDRIAELMRERMEAGFTEYICGNLGSLALCRELGARAHGSFGLNITNSWALDSFAKLGLCSAELSMELSKTEFEQVKGEIPRGLMVYGRAALMLSRRCPIQGDGSCAGCRSAQCLKDRKGAKFPVVCRSLDGKRGRLGTELLNSVPRWIFDLELPQVEIMVIRLTVENSVECGEILRAFQQAEKPKEAFTRGLFRRGVE